MALQAIDEGVKSAIDKIDKQSVQFRAVGNEAFTFPGNGAFGDLLGFGLRLAGDSDGLPAWWSPIRDRQLRGYVRMNPVLSAIVYGESTRVRNMSYTLSLEDGRSRKINRYHDLLRDCDFGKGFRSLTQKVSYDLLTQDNGAFIELVGSGGNRDTQRALDRSDIQTIAHLDASRCWRTYDPEYPVVYTNPYNAKYHIMHHTRVIMMSQNEQPDELARGLGFCATSRAFEMARYIYDMQTYKREKVSGSSPEIGILNGMSLPHFLKGLTDSGQANLNQGFIKFKNTAIIGPPGHGPNQPTASLDLVGLKSVPDGFDFKDELTVSMYLLAAAFGVDVREYFPLQSGGATKADATIQHAKSSGKGRADVMTLIEDAINYRVLPDFVTFAYDVKDDEEDKLRAENRSMRVSARATQISSGELTVQEARTMAAEEGDIDPAFLETQTVANDTQAPVDNPTPTSEADDEAEPPPEVIETTDEDEGEKSDSPKALSVAEKAIGGTRAFFATQMGTLINNAQLFDGSLRLGEFSGSLRGLITNGAIQALIDGLREGGSNLRINELPLDLTRQLNDHISQQWSYANNFANEVYGGALTIDTALARVPLWVSKAIDEMYFAGLLAADDTKKLKWVYGETEHCFIAGTIIETDKGQKAIENIQLGDKVLTLDGYKPVTKLWEREYSGELYEIKMDDRSVIATANHPFLTNEGWVRADELSTVDEIVLYENFNNRVFAHIALPNSINSIAARLKVFILRLIAFLLLLLPIGQSRKTRMSVPIVAIRLNDKTADFTIHDEFRFNHAKGFVFDTQFIQDSKQFKFKFSWLRPLNPSVTLKKQLHNTFVFFRVLFVMASHLCFGFWRMARIVSRQMVTCCTMHNNAIGVITQGQSENGNFIQYGLMGNTERFGTLRSAISGVMVNQKLGFFTSPHMTISTNATLVIQPIANVATSGTFTPMKSNTLRRNINPFSVLSGVVCIATRNATKAFSILRHNWFTAQFAIHEIPHSNDWFHHYTTLGTKVYNLAVADVQHYIANGFVVHNCEDCLYLNGKVYTAKQWRDAKIKPHMNELACGGYHCQCTLEETNDPLSPDEPTLPSGGVGNLSSILRPKRKKEHVHGSSN